MEFLGFVSIKHFMFWACGFAFGIVAGWCFVKSLKASVAIKYRLKEFKYKENIKALQSQIQRLESKE